MIKIILSAILMSLSAMTFSSCTSMQTQPLAGYPNNDAYTISCTKINTNSNNALCEMKANKLCSNGYTIIEKESHIIEYADSGDGFYIPPKEILAIQCKPV